MAGIMVQTFAFGIMGSAVGLAEDMATGVVDRFRSLPMARSAVLAGRALADILSSLIALAVLVVAGLIIGWGIHASVASAVAGFALTILFAYAMIWVGILLGLIVRSADAAQGVVFVLIFPLTFLASTFVATGDLPDGLRQFAEWNPISAVSTALRDLFGNPTGLPGGPRLAAAARGPGRDRLVRRDHRRLRPAGRRALPARHALTRFARGHGPRTGIWLSAPMRSLIPVLAAVALLSPRPRRRCPATRRSRRSPPPTARRSRSTRTGSRRATPAPSRTTAPPSRSPSTARGATTASGTRPRPRSAATAGCSSPGSSRSPAPTSCRTTTSPPASAARSWPTATTSPS